MRISDRLRARAKDLAATGALCALGTSVWAGSIEPCSPATCTWTLEVGGTTVESGSYSINPTTGAIVDTTANWAQNGTTTSVSLNGNTDPFLGFNFSAGTAGTSDNFTLVLSMPIALSGPISANSSVSYSLTAAPGPGASITPIAGATHVVTAFEESTVAGVPPLNKGVDVGGAFSVTGNPALGVTGSSSPYTASNLFNLAAGNLYNEMVLTVAFTLSANSNVGISGFVQQTPVPLPAGVWLFLSGGLGLIGVGRKRQSS